MSSSQHADETAPLLAPDSSLAPAGAGRAAAAPAANADNASYPWRLTQRLDVALLALSAPTLLALFAATIQASSPAGGIIYSYRLDEAIQLLALIHLPIFLLAVVNMRSGPPSSPAADADASVDAPVLPRFLGLNILLDVVLATLTVAWAGEVGVEMRWDDVCGKEGRGNMATCRVEQGVMWGLCGVALVGSAAIVMSYLVLLVVRLRAAWKGRWWERKTSWRFPTTGQVSVQVVVTVLRQGGGGLATAASATGAAAKEQRTVGAEGESTVVDVERAVGRSAEV